MSLLLDALKKAAQQKLDREKGDQQPGNDVGETQADDSTQYDAGAQAADETAIDSPLPATDETQIDATELAASARDRTEIDSTTIAAEPDNAIAGDAEKLEETRIDATSVDADHRSDLTEYDDSPFAATQKEERPLGQDEFGSTEIESSKQTTIAEPEVELELEPELTDLSSDTGLFRRPPGSETQYNPDDSELYSFEQENMPDVQARGERTTDFDLDSTNHDQTEQERTYSSSLTENLQVEHEKYFAGSPAQAAQVFSSKAPEPNGNRLRLILLSVVAGLALIGLGVLFGIDYLAKLNDNQVVRPIPRSRLEEPLSAALTRNQAGGGAQTANDVDPELLIEQEDYTELLQDTLTGYENQPKTGKASAQVAATQTKPVTAARRTTAGQSGEYTIRRSQPHGDSLNTVLMRGYRAYQSGNMDDAELIYRQALTRAPRNRDALLGMAAVNVARQDVNKARTYYEKLLELNPRDDLALAGMAGLEQQPSQAGADISRIKLMLTDRPDSAHLNFTLGNLYAGQSRWAEAQQAYFDAVRLDQKNPDYIFNLAVSLEHLGQKQAALRFYSQALTLSQERRSHFNQSLAMSRVQALSKQY